MKSISLVEYTPGKNGLADDLTEVARHFQSVWSTAVALVGDNCYLLGDAEGNLVVLNRNVNGVTADDKRRMEVTGEIRLGEMVNRIQPVNIQSPPTSAVSPKAFLATVSSDDYVAISS
jgi:DNA damage-binding protein 1